MSAEAGRKARNRWNPGRIVIALIVIALAIFITVGIDWVMLSIVYTSATLTELMWSNAFLVDALFYVFFAIYHLYRRQGEETAANLQWHGIVTFIMFCVGIFFLLCSFLIQLV